MLAPPRDDSPPSSIHLSHWTGTPLDRENLGCLLETGTLLCEVALPGELEAVAVVEQTGVPLLQPGAGVRLIIGGVPGGKVAGVVADVARLQADRAPLHLVAAGLVHNRQTNAGAIGPLPTTYEVRIALSDPPSSLVNGEIGWVSIAAPAEPLVTRLARWLGRNFRFGIGD
ncbi:MAG: hypothetical protein SFU86_17535 [Pirellulaceae bacterium]|nr:hypothetical protein [Pirellulaceae bacterium]